LISFEAKGPLSVFNIGKPSFGGGFCFELQSFTFILCYAATLFAVFAGPRVKA